MVRSSTTKIRDERSFPVRILFKVPEMGLGTRIEEIHRWLRLNVGEANYSWQAAGRATSGHDRVAVYLRRLGKAVALVEAFPDLEVSDTVEAIPKAKATPGRGS